MPLLLGGCGGAPKHGETITTSDGPPDAVPRVEPKARYGNMKSYVVYGKTYYPKQSSRGHVERGIASWYGPKFHGRKTSSGEPYDMHQMTAAHKTLPLPTYALVKNLENGRSAIVKVNDRGPFVGDRIIDLSYAAAKKLGVDQKGTARVEVVSIDPRDHDGKVPKYRRVAAQSQQRYKPQPQPKLAPRSSRTAQTIAATTAPKPPSEPTAPLSPQSPPQALGRSSSPPSTTTATALTPPAVASVAPTTTLAAVPAVASGLGTPLYLQVGAFGTRDNAEQLRRRLTGLLQDPVQVREASHGGAASQPQLYKVQVGPVASRSDADDLARRLALLGIARPLVVSD
ncbi:MAG: septal ring lytic transglycosylase RlpA family protein [Thiohalocapsa sp.]